MQRCEVATLRRMTGVSAVTIFASLLRQLPQLPWAEGCLHSSFGRPAGAQPRTNGRPGLRHAVGTLPHGSSPVAAHCVLLCISDAPLCDDGT